MKTRTVKFKTVLAVFLIALLAAAATLVIGANFLHTHAGERGIGPATSAFVNQGAAAEELTGNVTAASAIPESAAAVAELSGTGDDYVAWAGEETGDGDVSAGEEYALCRIIVEAAVSDETATDVCQVGDVTVLEYATPQQTAAAAERFNAAGYSCTADEEVEVTLAGCAGGAAGDEYVETTVQGAVTTWENERMGLSCAMYSGDGEASVAVIDTGCATEYLDEERIASTYNAQDDDEDVTDNSGHGTMTCSTVLRNTSESVSIVPIKVMDGNGTVYRTTFVLAFEYAAEAGCDVVSMSLGISIEADSSSAAYLGSYIDKLAAQGISVIVSAGNNAEGIDSTFPANWDSAWTISATDSDDELASWSNYGTESHEVDFSAPGVGVTVTTYEGKTAAASGTSFSAPLVACAAAELACMGYETDGERYAYLQEICDDLGEEGADSSFGYGLPVMEHDYSYLVEETSSSKSGCVVTSIYTEWCNCGENATEAVVSTEHSYVAETVKEATCGAAGQIAYTCSVCGDSYSEETAATDEHSYVTTVTKKATAKKAGTEKHVCSVCGDSYTAAIAASGKLAAKAKAKSVKVKASKLEKKAQTVKAAKFYKVKGAKGKVTYKKVSVEKAGKKASKKTAKKIVVGSNGKIVCKKNLAKGTYKVKVKIKDAGNTRYAARKASVTVTIKVK